MVINTYRPVGRAVTRSSLEREVGGSNLGPVKSDIVLPTARHRCDISSKGAVLPGRNDAEMGPANSLHASAYDSEYTERFDLIINTFLYENKYHFDAHLISIDSRTLHNIRISSLPCKTHHLRLSTPNASATKAQ